MVVEGSGDLPGQGPLRFRSDTRQRGLFRALVVLRAIPVLCHVLAAVGLRKLALAPFRAACRHPLHFVARGWHGQALHLGGQRGGRNYLPLLLLLRIGMIIRFLFLFKMIMILASLANNLYRRRARRASRTPKILKRRLLKHLRYPAPIIPQHTLLRC